MGKIGKFSLFTLLILTLSLIITVPTIVGFVNQVSDVNGEMGTVNFAPNDENVIGYSITYELSGGIANNPNSYTLFSDNFTLNNPTRDGYKFLGWTGSNGETPQMTVTICTGSCGDLEFTANYKALAYLKLEDSTLKWFLGDDVIEYQFYINDVEIESINNVFSIEIDTLNEFFKIGSNEIKIKYNESDYLTYNYYYYPEESFENLTLSFDFERLSDGYSISYTSDSLGKEIELHYSPTGELTYEYIRQGYFKPESFTYEEFFLQIISINNFSTVDYKLVLNDIEMIDLLKQIDSLYTEGNINANIDLSGKLKFIFTGDNMREYVPDNINVKVTYGSMYSETMVYDGATIDLTKCSSENISCVLYRNSEYSVFLDLVSIEGIEYQATVKYSEDSTVVGYSINVHTAEGNYTYANLTADEFNSMLSECKFYLNSEHYFKVKDTVNFSELINCIYFDSLSQRENDVNWTEEIEFNVNVSEYFEIYKNDETSVNFDCSLNVKYLTTTDWLWRT